MTKKTACQSLAWHKFMFWTWYYGVPHWCPRWNAACTDFMEAGRKTHYEQNNRVYFVQQWLKLNHKLPSIILQWPAFQSTVRQYETKMYKSPMLKLGVAHIEKSYFAIPVVLNINPLKSTGSDFFHTGFLNYTTRTNDTLSPVEILLNAS